MQLLPIGKKSRDFFLRTLKENIIDSFVDTNVPSSGYNIALEISTKLQSLYFIIIVFNMRLIIKKDTFDADRIYFKNNKTGIKLMYNISDVYMIGIPLKIKYEKIIVKDCIIFLNIDVYIDLY